VDPDNAAQSNVECRSVLALHVEYVDGALGRREAARVAAHLAACSSCARYDRIVRHGVQLVRELPQVAPSTDFEQRLQHRLFHIQDGTPLGEPRAPAAAATALAAASVIALLAWSPLLFSTAPESLTPAQAGALPGAAPAEAPQHTPLYLPLRAGQPDFWGATGVAGAMGVAGVLHGHSEAVRVLSAFPGPYSPLVVGPPVHGRSARTVSFEHAPVVD
jgi:hypothetical protein